MTAPFLAGIVCFLLIVSVLILMARVSFRVLDSMEERGRLCHEKKKAQLRAEAAERRRARRTGPAYAKRLRKEGHVVELDSDGTAGWVQVPGESKPYWTSACHLVDLTRGASLRIGMRVSFEPRSRPYGLLAAQVKGL